jgi:alkylation response protein AidB-like acyl-CoA dehydrogenase
MAELSWRRYAVDDQTLERIEAIRPVLERSEAVAERERCMPAEAVAAIRDAGLWLTASPRATGGHELMPLAEFEIYEAVSRISTVAGWTVFIGSFHTSLVAAHVGENAIAEMYAPGQSPLVAGQLGPFGRAEMGDGGLRVTGRYSWGSGINHASWVVGGALLARDDGPPGPVVWVAAKDLVDVLDNWHVAGLSGSGSYDYSVDDLFVADGYWFGFDAPVRRGGDRFLPPPQIQAVPSHCGVVLGAGARALTLVAETAWNKRRTRATTSLAHRGAFQRDLGVAFLRLSAARAYVAELLRELGARPWPEQPDQNALAAQLAGVITYATETAVDAASFAYHQAGASAARLDSPLQRILRDLLVAQQHYIAADTSYDEAGRWAMAHVAGLSAFAENPDQLMQVGST